jgi:aromatic ring-cleaving dioxygenase
VFDILLFIVIFIVNFYHTVCVSGKMLSWILVNRPMDVVCYVKAKESNGRSLDKNIICFGPPPISVAYANRPDFNSNPQIVVECYHLHCHFDSKTEESALAFLQKTKNHISGSGEHVLHSHVWHEKNGPHIGWSWEIWVETQSALGVAMAFWMQNRPSSLVLGFHCDTNQEYTDHSVRFAFVGTTDALDLNFFKELQGYEGPVQERRTCDRYVYSMGVKWPRRAGEFALAEESYGSVDRN